MAVNTLERCEASVWSLSAKWNERLRFIMLQVRIMLFVVKDPAVPWLAKLVALCSVGYIFSPIQLIPTFIPVIGQLDDLAVLLVGMKLLRRLTPAAVLADCEARAQSKARYVSRQELRPDIRISSGTSYSSEPVRL